MTPSRSGTRCPPNQRRPPATRRRQPANCGCTVKVTFCVRGVSSPLLANIFLHYVLDLWVHQWRRRRASGRVSIVRYADDFVMGFEKAADAQRMLVDLKDRLAKFGLTLHEDKTRLIEFGRLPALRRQQPASGVRQPSPFSASPIIAGGPGMAGLS
ncbi:MAG TPA: reverse transcriptase domain-containing protein [Stellaceae bacterium]|nr:reverse transcriptase domain-containing protein [Stellaceae bacterium]